MLRFVFIESPYAAPKGSIELEENLHYVRAAFADCFRRGEIPFASHNLYTQEGVLDDTIPEQRKQGIEAGFDMAAAVEFACRNGFTINDQECQFVRAFYIDRGWSTGMAQGESDARHKGQLTESRSLGCSWSKDRDFKRAMTRKGVITP